MIGAHRVRTNRLLIIAFVIVAVAVHEAVDLALVPRVPYAVVRIFALSLLSLLSIAFGLHLLNVHNLALEALARTSGENVSLQRELAETVSRLEESLELANFLNRQLQLSAALIESLHHCASEQELELRVGKGLAQVLANWSGCLYLGGADGDLRKRISWPKGAAFCGTFSPKRCPAFQERKPQIEGSFHCALCADKEQKANPRLWCFPLGSKEAPLGILCSHSSVSHPSSVMDTTATSVLGVVQSQLELAIQNLRSRQSLGDLAVRDALTGAFNRRYLEETLEREIARSLREKSPLALVMMDLDHFKQLNDTMGHDMGDIVLKALVRMLNEKFRTGDVVCRYGGEEFVVVMPSASALAARGRADQVRREIHDLSSLVRHQRMISVSMGLAVSPDNATDPLSLVRAADLALYEAKRRGRDRIVMAAPNPLANAERHGQALPY